MQFDVFLVFTHAQELQAIVDGFLLLQLHAAIGMADKMSSKIVLELALLQLRQNLYGLKDGQVTWHEHIKKGLQERGFLPSKVDPCLFIKGSVLLVLYTDDAAFFSPNAQAIDDEIASLKTAYGLTFGMVVPLGKVMYMSVFTLA